MYGNTNAEPIFRGSTATVNGVAGIVPAPLATDSKKFLTADGTWSDAIVLPQEVYTITGNGVKTEFTITHQLNTQNVLIQIYDNENGYTIIADSKRVDNTHIKLEFDEAVANNKTYIVLLTKIATAGVIHASGGSLISDNNYIAQLPPTMNKNIILASEEYVDNKSIITDEATGKKYTITINNGSLGIKEVE